MTFTKGNYLILKNETANKMNSTHLGPFLKEDLGCNVKIMRNLEKQ